MSLRCSAAALEFSVPVLLSKIRDCRPEVLMFTRFLILPLLMFDDPPFDVGSRCRLWDNVGTLGSAAAVGRFV